VVIVYYDFGNNYDAVVYGYGFNGDWFWTNGFLLSNNKYISFVIWKDYNCVGWLAISSYPKSFSYSESDKSAITDHIRGGYAGRNFGDVWMAAQDIQATIATTGGNIFSDKNAYSVVATQSADNTIYAKVCAKDYIAINSQPLPYCHILSMAYFNVFICH
jgi:hypothetical protein